jgi:hypothetical protein
MQRCSQVADDSGEQNYNSHLFVHLIVDNARHRRLELSGVEQLGENVILDMHSFFLQRPFIRSFAPISIKSYWAQFFGDAFAVQGELEIGGLADHSRPIPHHEKQEGCSPPEQVGTVFQITANHVTMPPVAVAKPGDDHAVGQ